MARKKQTVLQNVPVNDPAQYLETVFKRLQLEIVSKGLVYTTCPHCNGTALAEAIISLRVPDTSKYIWEHHLPIILKALKQTSNVHIGSQYLWSDQQNRAGYLWVVIVRGENAQKVNDVIALMEDIMSRIKKTPVIPRGTQLQIAVPGVEGRSKTAVTGKPYSIAEANTL